MLKEKNHHTKSEIKKSNWKHGLEPSVTYNAILALQSGKGGGVNFFKIRKFMINP